jgi:hypothetical protein
MGASNGEPEGETDRVTVKTYVPRYQKEEWRSRAADLDMSQSEFVRTMVQAGKREFDIPEEDRSGGATPSSDGLKEQVLDAIGSNGPLEWQDLVAELIDDFETQLEESLQELQRENRVQHSGRKGYTLTDE